MVLIINLLDFSNFIFMKKLIFILITCFFSNVYSQTPTVDYFSETCSTFTLKITKLGYNGNATLSFGQTPVGFTPAIASFANPNITINFVNGVGYVTGNRLHTLDDETTVFTLESFNSTAYTGTAINQPQGTYYDKSFNILIDPVLTSNNNCGTGFIFFLGQGRGIYQTINEPNTTFDIYCQLSGANTGSFTLYNYPLGDIFDAGFQIPSNLLVNSGNTTLTITQIVRQPSSSCYENIAYPNISTNFNVSGNINAATINVNEPLCNGNNALVNFSTSFYPSGTYSIFYTLSGANSGSYSASNVVVSSGTGTFTIPSSSLINSGSTTIDIDGLFSSDFSVLCNYPDGTISDIFSVNSIPNLSGTNTVSVLEPLCLGSNGTVSFSSTSLLPGTYDISYTLTGSNSGTYIANNILFTSGTSVFSIPSTVLVNSGNNVININSISNSGCVTSIPNGTIFDSFSIGVFPNISGTNTVNVLEPLCLGSNGTVNFSSTTLLDGNYLISYSLSGSNNTPGAVLSSNFVFASGTGTFTIPTSALSTAGITNIEIHLIINTVNGCVSDFPSGSITDSFLISILPNMTGTKSISVSEPLCLVSNGTLTFNDSALANVTYYIIYCLSVTNSGTYTAANVVFASGTGTFTIP